jgi:hypothetical protein
LREVFTLDSLLCFAFAYTVGIYSPGKAFVVYEMSRHVLPTALDEMMVHKGFGG